MAGEEDPSALVKASLLNTAEVIQHTPVDDYSDWKRRSDLFVLAVEQLETRQIESDGAFLLLGVPLSEAKMRSAAEDALRNCAHFATTFEERVALVDAANRVRNTTWF